MASRVTATPGEPLGELGGYESPILLHVNLTRPRLAFPDFDRWLGLKREHGISVINGGLQSIDKRAVQQACVDAGLPMVRTTAPGDPDELLVIKPDANHVGKYERTLDRRWLGGVTPPNWSPKDRINVVRRGDIAPERWIDPRFVVERFVRNHDGRFHRAYVMGTYVAAATARVEWDLKEMDHRSSDGFRATENGDELRHDVCDPLFVAYRLARTLRADYCAIDIAVDDQNVAHAIDLNSTPFWGDDRNDELIAGLARAFSEFAATVTL